MTNVFRTTSVVLIGMVCAALMLLVAPQAALAHDVLVGQSPEDGETFEEAPETITLSFNNSLLDVGEEATVINVIDAEQRTLDLGSAEVRDRDAVLVLGDLADGAYHVTWRVVSSDGHPISGTFSFGIGENAEEALAELPPLDLSNVDDDEAQDENATEQHEDTRRQFSAVPIAIMTLLALGLVSLGGIMIWRKFRQ